MAEYETQKPLKTILKEKVEVAKDLRYPKEVIARIRKAKSEIEAENYLADARRAM